MKSTPRKHLEGPAALARTQQLLLAAENGFKALLELCGDNPDREGVLESPKRYVKAMREMMSGYQEDPALHLRKSFDVNDVTDHVTAYDELIISGGLTFVSNCEHHGICFHGTAWIGYIPNVKKGGRVVGLSKIARMLDGYAKRFQVQERLTRQIGDAIVRELKPIGVGVVIKARHTCQCFRGVKKDGHMITSAMYGVLKEKPSAKEEFLKLITL